MNNIVMQGKVIELLGGRMAISPVIPIGFMIVICIAILCFKRRGWLPFLRQLTIVLLLFMVNLRIVIPNSITTVKQESIGAKVLFVIDDTISMVAEDYNGDERRLDAVKADCNYIIDELEGAKFAVVSFNNVSQIMAPYSPDATFTKSVIASIQPLQELYANGTTLNVCHDDMLNMLKTASDDGKDKVILFFISDGEITSSDELKSFEDAKEYIDGGAVLGYGTEEGGRMQVLNYDDEWEVIMDKRDWMNVKVAISSIDEDNLRTVAQDVGVDYVHMTEQQKINDVLDDVKKHAMANTVEKKQKNYLETYYIFAIPLAAMLVWEFILLKRKK